MRAAGDVLDGGRELVDTVGATYPSCATYHLRDTYPKPYHLRDTDPKPYHLRDTYPKPYHLRDTYPKPSHLNPSSTRAALRPEP